MAVEHSFNKHSGLSFKHTFFKFKEAYVVDPYSTFSINSFISGGTRTGPLKGCPWQFPLGDMNPGEENNSCFFCTWSRSFVSSAGLKYDTPSRIILLKSNPCEIRKSRLELWTKRNNIYLTIYLQLLAVLFYERERDGDSTCMHVHMHLRTHTHLYYKI